MNRHYAGHLSNKSEFRPNSTENDLENWTLVGGSIKHGATKASPASSNNNRYEQKSGRSFSDIGLKIITKGMVFRCAPKKPLVKSILNKLSFSDAVWRQRLAFHFDVSSPTRRSGWRSQERYDRETSRLC